MKGHELKQGKTLTFLLIGAMLFHSTSTMANEMLWDRISKREDAKITIRKSLDGRDLRSANFQGGVTFSETERGDTIATDNRGKGAILCEWAIYNELKKHADRCNATPEDKNFLNTSLKKKKEFIVANSIELVSEKHLEEMIVGQQSDLIDRTTELPDALRKEQCQSSA